MLILFPAWEKEKARKRAMMIPSHRIHTLAHVKLHFPINSHPNQTRASYYWAMYPIPLPIRLLYPLSSIINYHLSIINDQARRRRRRKGGKKNPSVHHTNYITLTNRTFFPNLPLAQVKTTLGGKLVPG